MDLIAPIPLRTKITTESVGGLITRTQVNGVPFSDIQRIHEHWCDEAKRRVPLGIRRIQLIVSWLKRTKALPEPFCAEDLCHAITCHLRTLPRPLSRHSDDLAAILCTKERILSLLGTS